MMKKHHVKYLAIDMHHSASSPAAYELFQKELDVFCSIFFYRLASSAGALAHEIHPISMLS
jgi:hypothetical protein